MSPRKIILSVAVFINAFAAATADAGTVSLSAAGADFRVFVPNATTIRGVIASFNGAGADFRGEADKPANQAVATSWGFAYVGTRAFGGANGAALAATLNEALVQAGSMTSHPELKNAPLLLTGHSNGGRAACALVAAIPTRVLAFAAYRGATTQTLSVEAKRVPGLITIGSADSSSAGDWEAFLQWRSQGALVAFGVEWLSPHVPVPAEDGTTWTLTWLYFNEIIRLRYPKDRAPTASAPPALETLSEPSGWLASHPLWSANNSATRTSAFPEIAAFATYTADKPTASWLPNQAAAQHFRAYVARDKLATGAPPRNVPLRFTSPITMNGTDLTLAKDGALAIKVDPRTLTGITEMQFFSGPTLLATLTKPPWEVNVMNVPPGIHGLTLVATSDTGKHAGFETYLMTGDAAFGEGEGTLAGGGAGGAGGAMGNGGAGEAGGSGGVATPTGNGGTAGSESAGGSGGPSAMEEEPKTESKSSGCALGGVASPASIAELAALLCSAILWHRRRRGRS